MAQDHKLNGTTINYITNPNWIEQPAGQYLNGETVRNRFRLHTWQTEVMPASEFDTLYALKGQLVTLVTTDYDDRTGDYKTYYGAEFRKIESQHIGPNLQSLVLEFLVRVI